MQATVRIATAPYEYIELTGKHNELDDMLLIRDKYAEKPMTAQNNGTFVKFDTFTGEHVLYNGKTHIYTSLDGKKLVSGSAFAKQFGKSFDKEGISARMAQKHGIDQKVIKEVWHENGDASRGFGTAVHKVLENYFRYRHMKDIYKLPKHTMLSTILTTFPHYGEECVCEPEAIVSCVKRKMVGRLDNIIWVDNKKKIVDIWDYKFAGKLGKNDLYKYSIQLNYYRKTLEFMGFTVRKMLLQNYDEKWEEYEIKVMDINNLAKKEATI
jgi:hypothetical protein